jgi:anti-anti-sigma factor
MTDAPGSRPPPDQASPPGRTWAASAEDPPGDGTAPILDQVFDHDSLYALRAAVAAHASQAGLPSGRADDLVIALHELAANAVRHGAGHGRLRIWQLDHGLLCQVSDDGAAQDAGAAHPDPGAASRDAARWPIEPGHGLWLVRQIADGISLRSSPLGTVASVSLSFSSPGPLPAPGLVQRSVRGCVVLVMTGPLDVNSAGQFTDAVGNLAAGTPGLRLVADLTDLTWWDSAGLAALVSAQQRISASPPARLVLAGLPGHLVQRLRESGLADRFTLAASTAAALGVLTADQP